MSQELNIPFKGFEIVEERTLDDGSIEIAFEADFPLGLLSGKLYFATEAHALVWKRTL
jgi:hypothetical protein